MMLALTLMLLLMLLMLLLTLLLILQKQLQTCRMLLAILRRIPDAVASNICIVLVAACAFKYIATDTCWL
jgi:hypothetical protein